jgi:Do/DeqQ family serine protease
MNKTQFFFGLILASFIGAALAIGGMQYFAPEQEAGTSQEVITPAHFANYLEDKNFTVPDGLNFVYAAEVSTPAVVHIRSTFEGRSYSNSMDDFWEFFGYRQPDSEQQRRGPQQRGFGSGVIISADGYIITNNHVIDNAGEIEVTLSDKRDYDARLVGTDPNTDLALLKIEENQLPYVNMGNSDDLRVGEWVLAVGNPFAQGTPWDLTSTVTAGIVSAKGRNINILGGGYGIESFIQTDAAVNPGNSGGALVNLKGELVGINTAIATPSRTFAGYSFAIPATLVKKVIEDLKEYGVVQRALLGVQIRDVDADFAEERDIDDVGGVYIMEVNDNSAAEEAGLQKGDIIVNIGNVPVNTTAELQELVARNSPGDKISVSYKRNGKKYTTEAVLRNLQGDTGVLTFDNTNSFDGAVFNEANDEVLEELDLRGGVEITQIGKGKWKDEGIKPGFIITHVNKTPVDNVDQVMNILKTKKGGNLIEGMYRDGEQRYYAIGW